MESPVYNLLAKYEEGHLRLKKTCDEKCDGNNKECQKCKVIGTHRFLREELTTYIRDLPDIENNYNDDIYSFLTGSYKRGTILPPPKDVDLFEVMKKREDSKSPADIMNIFYAALEAIYPKKAEQGKIHVQTHSITVEIDDEFSIDVIPAFEKGDTYTIPEVKENGEESWIESNPRKHEELIHLVNDKDHMDGNFLPIARLVKSFRKFSIKPLGLKVAAFHLEMIAATIFLKHSYVSINLALLAFFDEARVLCASPLPDIANTSRNIDDDLPEIDRNTLIEILTQVYQIARSATIFESEQDYINAIEEWKKIFKDPMFKELANQAIEEEKKKSTITELSLAISTGNVFVNNGDSVLSSYGEEYARVPRSSSYGEVVSCSGTKAIVLD